MNFKDKTVLVAGKGIFLHVPVKLARAGCKVFYWLQGEMSDPKSPRAKIGTGFEGIERIKCPWPYKDEVDLWVFPDVYNAGIVESLRKEGRLVFGAGAAEELELDRVLLKDTLKDVGLPVGPYKIIEGVDRLRDYLSKRTDLHIKLSYYRGDFETFHHEDIALTNYWLDDLAQRLGLNKDEIEFIVESPIESDVEIGFDGFCVDGKFPEYSGMGYERKNEWYIGKIAREVSPLLIEVNDKMSSIMEDYGYRGAYTNELMITKDGTPYYTDATCRMGIPPSEGQMIAYTDESYAQALFDIAAGEMPALEVDSEDGEDEIYFFEILLYSPYALKKQLPVKFPPSIEPFVCLRNAAKIKDGFHVCIPNPEAEGFSIGAVAGKGATPEAAYAQARDNAAKIQTLELQYSENAEEKMKKTIEAGEEVGIEF
jgi:hypothetical protein